MKRIPREANRFRAASTTSTTGPHVRLVQNSGVANVSTNGTCATSEAATEYRSSARSGGTRVVNALTGAVASVGVGDAIAFAPIAGLVERAFTERIERPWIGVPPTGCASTQYRPGRARRRCATKTFVTPPNAASDSPGNSI